MRPLLVAQGMAFARKAFGGEEGAKPDYDAIPSAVFSSPPIATVGLTEEQAAASHSNVDIYTSSFKCAAPNALSGWPRLHRQTACLCAGARVTPSLCLRQGSSGAGPCSPPRRVLVHSGRAHRSGCPVRAEVAGGAYRQPSTYGGPGGHRGADPKRAGLATRELRQERAQGPKCEPQTLKIINAGR